uniref:Rrn7/TAF1B N-terminal cyclin domain-containing protein n=1 Tax=Leucosporidium scottii TaxID=5278 RepID=A0A0H5G9S0_9BASI|nr:hypothetical protein ls5930a1_00103 [Leucosporidium scottii]
MARKPRCPVCHSKRWHRDGLSGSIVCEEGHLLQGYVQESNETHELSQHVTQTRRLRKKRTKKVKPLPNLYFHGERGTFILWQALQWVLREQLRVLIEELGWPVELEGVCRDLWGMLVASSGVPNAPGDYLKGDEPATSFCGPREGARYSRRRTNQAKTDLDDEEENGAQGGSQSEGEHGGSGVDADDSDSFVSSDEDGERDEDPSPRKRARTTSPPPQNDDPPPPPVNLYDEVKPPPLAEQKPRSINPRSHPRMEHLLLVIYLGCVTLRLPTFMNDILQ